MKIIIQKILPWAAINPTIDKKARVDKSPFIFANVLQNFLKSHFQANIKFQFSPRAACDTSPFLQECTAKAWGYTNESAMPFREPLVHCTSALLHWTTALLHCLSRLATANLKCVH